jgi:hypothetical protein
MRAAALFAFGAVLGLNTLKVDVEVICDTKQPPNTGDLPGAQSKEVFQATINKTIIDVCTTEPSVEENDGFINYRSGSTVLTITRTDNPETFDIERCKDQFHNIIKQCITEQDVMGGTVLTGGLIYEVYNDDPQDSDVILLKDSKVNAFTKRLPNEGDVESAGIEARRVKKSESTKAKKPKAKKPNAKKPNAKKPNAKKPATKQPLIAAEKPKSEKPKPKASPKSCPIPAQGKGKNGKGKSGKEGVIKATRDELIRRVECQGSDVSMFQRGGRGIGSWGTTWFGFVKEPANSQWTRTTIKEFALEGWRQASASGEKTLVSALWVVGDGVWLGSIPHGRDRNTGNGGQRGFGVALSASGQPRLFAAIGHRILVHDGTTLWHAEDVAMLEYENARRDVRPADRYPRLTYITTYGQRFTESRPQFEPPCSGTSAKINPTCNTALRQLGVQY